MLLDFLHKLGIPPLFFVTLVMIVISLFDVKNLKKWDKLSPFKKRFLIIEWISTAMFILWSIVGLIAIIFN